MTYLIRRNPVRNVLATQDAVNRLFEESFNWPFGLRYWSSDSAGIQPLALDVTENEDAFVITANIPGFAPEDVDVSIQENVVSLKVSRKVEEKADDADQTESPKPVYHLRERRVYTSYERAITLPVDVNAETAEAVVENGILTLTLPKVEEVKPKRIEVKVN